MSYILDALRRADSERERKRGAVPGLNAQPVPLDVMDSAPSGRGRLWVWVLATVCLGLVVLAVWRLIARDEPEEPSPLSARAPVSGTTTPSGTVPAPTAPAAPAAGLPTPVALSPVPSTTVPPTAATPAPMASTPQTAAAPRARPQPVNLAAATRPTAPKPGAGAAPPRGNNAAPTEPQLGAGGGQAPAAAGQPEAQVPKLAEIADELRREVPAMAFGGSVYSTAAAQRMVIVNGQLMREGEAMSAELTLVEIRPKSAVFRIRDQRFEWPF